MDNSTDLFRRLEQLNAIGAALSKERDTNRLLETILIAAKTITHADGGTLYRMTEDRRALRFEILRTDSLNIAMGGTTGVAINFPNLPLTNDKGEVTTVNKTWGWVRDADGDLRIVLHHSSLPYDPD